jgi:thiol-disulfide isomerase/thioredoxin
MIPKRLILLIILFCPVVLAAQSSAKNNSSKKHAPETKVGVKKHTYADDEIMLANMEKSVTIKIESAKKLINEKNNELIKISDSSAKNAAQQNIDSLNEVLAQLFTQLITVEFDFIRNNPSSFLSIDRLSMILRRNVELPFYVDTIITLYNHLNKNIQNSVSGRHFKLMLTNLNNSKVGSLAPQFTLNDINNHPISLSSFRSKEYVLLDFWASWCVPCRSDIPRLKEISKKYHQNGLEIIGISKDDYSLLWKKAIAEDKTQNWGHILAPFSKQNIDSLITNKYSVYAIPVKILINKEGLIIGRWSGSGDENMDELEKLLDKNFGKN